MASAHKVKPGECLSSIANKFGFLDFRAIYDHPKNAQFKRNRPNPNIIQPGDTLFIPDKQDKKAPGSTGQTLAFQIPPGEVLLRVVLKDGRDQPFAGKNFVLKVNNKITRGSLDGSGLLEEKVPPDATEGELTLFPSDDDPRAALTFKLRIGFLDPVTSFSGAQARMTNLGIPCGAVDNIFGPKTEAGLRAFQKRSGLPESGKLDAATRAALESAHDAA